MPDPIQRALGLAAALLTLPILAVLALLVRLDSAGPVFYDSTRMGEGGRPFACRKLRTMTWRPQDPGLGLTTAEDARVTRVGRWLRGARLDELPQLWHVASGRMRLVGPRPEDPRYVDLADPLHRLVFTARPGITGLAQLLHTDEASRLGGPDPDATYRREILPRKVRIDAAYLRHRSTRLDLWILAATPLAVLGRPPAPPAWVATEVAA